MRRGAVILFVLVAACSSSRNTESEPTLVPAAQPISSGSPSVENQLVTLQTSMTELLDRLDVLNERIAKLESGGQPPTAVRVQPPQPAPAQGQPRAAVLASADVAENYRQALMLIGSGKHAEARAAFQRVFDAEPTGHLADNALFWIGETYYQSGDYTSAMRYYERVIKEYAEENKAPDAMLKLGVAYAKTGDLGMARRTLEECIRKYPYSPSAASAKLELKRIKY
ncbi:MAG TPA: tol-pal system protein YbgF [Thermoanaerobaculia bacterium]